MKQTKELKEFESLLNPIVPEAFSDDSDTLLDGMKMTRGKLLNLFKLSKIIIEQNRELVDNFEIGDVKEMEILSEPEILHQYGSLVGLCKREMDLYGKVEGFLSFYSAFKHILESEFDRGIHLVSRIINVDLIFPRILPEDAVDVIKELSRKCGIKSTKSKDLGVSIGLSGNEIRALKVSASSLIKDFGEDLLQGKENIPLPENFIKGFNFIRDNLALMERVTNLFEFEDEIGKDGALFAILSVQVSRAANSAMSVTVIKK